MQEKNKVEIAFVILQFGAYYATKKCIESIYKNVEKDFAIIVVDNCSPDNSLLLLRQDYSLQKEIIIIESEKNLGFSSGNNLGYQYAKQHMSPQFIVLMNNDTELLFDSFLNEVKREYGLSKFAVMGPMILSGDGKYISSPSRTNIWREDEVRKCIQIESFFLKLEKLNMGFLYDRYMEIKQRKKKKRILAQALYIQRQENVELHGSFMIFSRKYIDLFDGLDARTFLYCEEPLLYLRLKKYNLKSVYNPRIVIYHAEDASTDCAHKRGKQKKIFYFETHINSCKSFLDAMHDYLGLIGEK